MVLSWSLETTGKKVSPDFCADVQGQPIWKDTACLEYTNMVNWRVWKTSLVIFFNQEGFYLITDKTTHGNELDFNLHIS